MPGRKLGSAGMAGRRRRRSLTAWLGWLGSSTGELYICDVRNARVRKVSRDGAVITTIAGTGGVDRTGDGGPATEGPEAPMGNPRGVAVDRAGNVFVSDSLNNVIRKIDGQGWCWRAFVGAAAGLRSPGGMAFDAQGNLLVADTGNNRVRRVGAEGTVETLAGTGVAGSQGGTTTALGTQIERALGRGGESGGEVFICDRLNGRILRVRGTAISIVAGNGSSKTVRDRRRRLAWGCRGDHDGRG